VTIEQFGEDLSRNLYRLWNRMSSGSYFPGPVRAVEIHGGRRPGQTLWIAAQNSPNRKPGEECLCAADSEKPRFGAVGTA
jgi:hypothetical protein